MKIVKQFYLVFFLLLLSIASHALDKPSFVLVLDAGHGGKDPGAVGSKIYEKKINLAVVLGVGQLVEKNCPDVKVVYTRNTDVYLTLQERADVANNAHGDLFISVHTNANNSSTAFGTETYTLGLTKSKSNLDVAMRENAVILLEEDYKTKYSGFDPNSVDSYIMFEFMQDNFIDKSQVFASAVQSNFVSICNRKDKGVRQAGFWVLHKTAMPSVLVEVGFLTNPEEQDFLASTTGQTKLAEAIYQAFVVYKNEIQRKSGNQTYSDKAIVAQNQTTVTTTTTTSTTETIEITPSERNAKEQSSQKQTARNVDVVPVNVKKEEPVAKQVEAKSSVDTKEKKTEPVKTQQTVSSVQTSSAKNISVKESKSTTVVSSTTTVQTEQVERPVYKLQLFAVSKVLPTNSPSFKGLIAKYYLEGGLYKYTHGEEYTYIGIEAVKKKIAPKFPDALIVAFYKGKKITVNEAKELEKFKK